MPVCALFPTLVYTAKLQPAGWEPFNARLLRKPDGRPENRAWVTLGY